MSTNGVNVEDAEMAECDGEKVVTMMDVLQEQQEFEEDANAVLGASDDKNCTYNKGYIKRQALYACLTCCSEAKEDPSKRAGVCLACSLTCHENHDLVELYTKRNFCCDCGNPKFNHPCQYTPKKTDLNDENKYNQNFSGLYCTCHRPYPDPDGVEEEMIQCIVCEDWLHASHLEATVPSSEAYAEMICKGCMEKNDFLHDYSRYAVNGEVDVSINESDISICNGDSSKLNGVDEAEKEHADKEEVADVAVEQPKDGGEGADVDSAVKLLDNTDLPESENPSLTNDDIKDNDENKDEQMEPKITDSENTNGDKPDENEDKPEEGPVAEETALEKAVEEQNNTSSDDTEKVKDASETEVTETESKEESSVDNSEIKASIDTDNSANVSINDAKDETGTEQKQEESPVSTKEASETDANTEETAADQVSKDEIEPKTNETETETSKEDTNEIPTDQPVSSEENEKDSAEPNANDSTEKDIEMNESSKVEENTSEDQTKENKRKFSTEEEADVTSVKKPKLEGSKCTRPRNERKVFKGSTFWPSQFRQKLCTCNECIAMYQDLSVLFLIDPEDTVSAYEALGKERTDGTASTQYEKGLEALSSLGRIQQINALTEYNKMRDKLLDFLKSFKDRKEVVKEDDIKAFFAGMKPKREPDGVYFCK